MPHMILDAYGVDYATLSDYRATFEFLTSLVKAIDMQLVAGPFCVPYKTEEPVKATYSWFVIIATSHISLHLFPHRGMVMLDVFSCQEFSVETVVQLVERHFLTSDIDFHPIVRRATRSPRPAEV
jgi:S-adenosylmethionine decarboxylase